MSASDRPRATFSSDRTRTIENALAMNGKVEVAALADQLGVSAMTVRRDLDMLAEAGTVRRVRGGAVVDPSRSYEPPFTARMAQEREAKQRIAAAAAAMLSDGETAIIDVGTTPLAVAQALKGRRNLTIVTPSVRAAQELALEPGIRTILTGGIVRSSELSLVGPLAEQAFSDLNCDTAFIGVAGLDAKKGLTDYNLDDGRIKRVAISSARQCVVVADATKLGRVAFAKVAALEDIDVLITDAPGDHPTVRAALDIGIQVVHPEE